MRASRGLKWENKMYKLKRSINTNQVKCWFLRRGKTVVPRENLRVESHQTQPTYDAGSGNGTQATLVGGE